MKLGNLSIFTLYSSKRFMLSNMTQITLCYSSGPQSMMLNFQDSSLSSLSLWKNMLCDGIGSFFFIPAWIYLICSKKAMWWVACNLDKEITITNLGELIIQCEEVLIFLWHHHFLAVALIHIILIEIGFLCELAQISISFLTKVRLKLFLLNTSFHFSNDIHILQPVPNLWQLGDVTWLNLIFHQTCHLLPQLLLHTLLLIFDVINDIISIIQPLITPFQCYPKLTRNQLLRKPMCVLLLFDKPKDIFRDPLLFDYLLQLEDRKFLPVVEI